MRLARQSGLICAALALSSCAGDESAREGLAPIAAIAPDPRVTVRTGPSFRVETSALADTGDRMIASGRRDEKWTGGFSAYLRALSDESCPAGIGRGKAETIEINALPVALQPLNASRRKAGELTFVAGFQLTSPDPRFGGLSGLDISEEGGLLAVSDKDAFIWIDLAKDGVTPTGARISGMKSPRGESLDDEENGDAEGLAVNGGTALVSFDRKHRVLAFDLGKCGAAARGAPIVFGPFGLPLWEAYDESRIVVDDAAGTEALAVTSDWYLFSGIETKVGQLSPMSARPLEADSEFSLRVGVGAQAFVGLDVLPATRDAGIRAFTLHRSFSPRSGYAVTIAETDFVRYFDAPSQKRAIDPDIDQRARFRFVETGWRQLAEFDMLMTIDNFEGIAAKEMPDGRTRLFVVSDDNFSATQRTLLMIFDLAKPMR